METELENAKSLHRYSFEDEFVQFSLIKKIITIIFIPLLPIHILSRLLQYRKWNLIDSTDPPQRIHYLMALTSAYILLIYSPFVTLFLINIQILLFPLPILVALFLDRKLNNIS